MTNHEVTIERLSAYSDVDAAGIGRLAPFLSGKFSDEPMAEGLLRKIIDSPSSDQLVARLDGVIVGAATMNIVMGLGANEEGWLMGFVTDPAVRGQGIGDKVWQEMIDWCEERDVELGFTSHPSREAAHRFYLNHGAEIRDTTVFRVATD